MTKHTNILILLIAIAFAACTTSQKHFMSDKSYRNEVINDFNAREFPSKRQFQLDSIFADKSIRLEVREAMQFLYAYMPLSDVADLDASYIKQQVDYAFKAREEFAWGKSVPEDIFRHFVLVHRVNNENMDTARVVFFNELRDRVKGLSMYDAALEVNHWCHEKVTYRPSDTRTSSPLATMRTSLGRCGEESTFTVTALRSVGIPARQCYTPRWAHTDDNHAWVEAWIDGRWYYLGACEPDIKLNMGWFSIPATRTMMVHSNVYGKYNGTEEINESSQLFVRANMLGNYTKTRNITITVTDEDGNPAEGAKVHFKLYNYAEYYSISTSTTDSKGEAHLTTGFGDLMIWAAKDGMYNYAALDVRSQSSLTLALTRKAGEEYIEEFDLVPPAEGRVEKDYTEAEAAENRARLAYEDSVRNAYVATFPKSGFVETIHNENLTNDQIWSAIQRAEGNYAEIASFLNNGLVAKQDQQLHLPEFIESLSDKDLRDATASTLIQMVQRHNTQLHPLDVYLKGIMPARISNEMLRPYHKELKSRLLQKGYSLLAAVEHYVRTEIRVDDKMNYAGCPISAVGVMDLGVADAHSRDIFFVAACRSVDIPAYLDNATGEVFAWETEWKRISFSDEQSSQETGYLEISYNGDREVMPEYWVHYTIARFENGTFQTFDFEGDERVKEFPIRLSLEPGYYMLSTGSRYSDGTTLARLQFFNIESNQTKSLSLELRPLTTRDINYGTINIANYPVGEKSTLKEMTENHDAIIAFVDPNREPTRHLVNDMKRYRAQLDQWGGEIIVWTPKSLVTKDYNEAALKAAMPRNTRLYIDEDGVMELLLTEADIYFRDNYPLVLIIDNNGNITFKTEGYRIGTGELLYRSLKK